MREVIVTVGPRASGKSRFCEGVIALDQSIVLVSRDAILTEFFGGALLDPYSGGHEYAFERVWELVEERLKSSSSLRMILDTWNGTSDERRDIIRRLRHLGADRIVAWYFVTPATHVEEWFWKKPGIAKVEEMQTRKGQGLIFFTEGAPRRDCKLFHKFAAGIASDGFDTIVKINPLVMRPEQALNAVR